MSPPRHEPWEVRLYRSVIARLPGRLLRLHGSDMAALLRDRLVEVGPRPVARMRMLAGALLDAVRHGRAVRPPSPTPPVAAPRASAFAESVLQDMRFALRSLRRRPLFTVVAIVTLGLGIGGTTAIYSVVDAVLVRALPFRDPETLVSVWRAWPDWRGREVLDYVWDHIHFPVEDYLALHEGNRAFTAVEATVHRRLPLALADRTQDVGVGFATGGLFEMLGVRPLIGRTFGPDETLPSPRGARVAVISAQLWRAAYGGDPRWVGREISLGGELYEVVGVLPEGFRLPSDLVTITDNAGAADAGLRDVWLPLGGAEAECGNCVELLARLAPGVTLEQARADVRRFLVEGPSNQLARVIPRKDFLIRGAATPLLLLLAAAAILLLVACLNVAGLLLGEATGRGEEVAVRTALGAGRARVARQLLTESALLGVSGAGLGLLVAWVCTDGLLRLAPPIPRLDEVALSGRILALTVGTGLGTGLLFGLAPTVGLVARGVRLGTRGGTSGAGTRRSYAVVVALQVGLTVALLVAGGLFERSLSRLMTVDPGFSADGLATISYTIPVEPSASAEARLSFHEEVMRSVRTVPGVRAVTATDELPFPGGDFSRAFRIERRGESVQTTFWSRTVMPDYFETMEIDLLAGRPFTAADGPGAPQVVVVSRSLAERSWPGESPLGKRIHDGAREPWEWTVVGVVDDVRQKALGAEPQPTFYRPLAQRPPARVHLAVRVAGDPRDALQALQRAVWSVDPSISIASTGVMSRLMRDSEADDRFRALLVTTFAVLATVLAAVGIFGVTARGVASRRLELGIRSALGAGAPRLLVLVLRDGMTSALAGVGLGLILAWSVAGGLAGMLYGVEPRDPKVFATVALLALGVCLLASWIPARRATRTDPREAMRGT